MLQLYINYYYVDNFALLLGNHKNLTSIKNERWKNWMCVLYSKIYLERLVKSLMQLCIQRVMGILVANAQKFQSQVKFKFNHHHQLFVVKIFRICTISANHKKKGNVSWICHPWLLPSQKSVFVWHSIVFKTNSWSCSYCVLSATCGGTYQYLLSFRRGTRFPFGRSGCHRCGHTKWADGLVHVQKFFVRHLHDVTVSFCL